MSDVVTLITDGACLGNPGPGGWAALMRWKNHEKCLWGHVPDTTNNRMELTAIIQGLQGLTRPMVVTVITDSQYVCQGVTLWLAQWIRNGWRTASKKPVKNQDLWQELEQAARPHTLTWQWVKGHSGHVDNERVDKMARQAALGLAPDKNE